MARASETYRGARRAAARELGTSFTPLAFDVFLPLPKGKDALRLRQVKQKRFGSGASYVPFMAEVTKYFPHQSKREMARRRAHLETLL